MQTIYIMQQATLKDFVGEPTEFYLSKLNRSFHLRPFTVGDQVWVQQQFGANFNLANMPSDKICRLAFQLMTLEDQKEFLSREVEFVNDQGENFKKKVGGAELLFWNVIGLFELQEISVAIAKSISGSKVVQQALDDEEKKRQLSKLTGEKSSTSSPSSTDGQQSKFSSAQNENSLSGSKPSGDVTH